MDWWMWLAGGLLLLAAELATPSGFFIMFFGLGALSVGVLARIGVAAAPAVQWLLFPVLSLGYLLLFRGKLQRRVQAPPPPHVDSLVGVIAVPQSAIEPGAVGRVEVRGSPWSARNGAAVTVYSGQRCTVIGVDGLLLTVRPE
jgi:membrane protein implicated in regulation of membrane protease activity